MKELSVEQIIGLYEAKESLDRDYIFPYQSLILDVEFLDASGFDTINISPNRS